jgi:thymidylate synthase ThyX
VFAELNIPKKFTYPYKSEQFSKKEKEVLSNFFTNIDKPVFAIYNLPQEVVGAMFSRYSRSDKSIRRLFLDEFWDPTISSFSLNIKKLKKAEERTSNFYKKVYAEFGDDSVIQVGSVHIAFEYVSQLAAKAIEDQRIGAAYIEKSTRYVNFGSNKDGRFLYMDVPEINKLPVYKEYRKWNDMAFNFYNKNLLIAIEFLRNKYPIDEQTFELISTGKAFKFKDIKDELEKEKLQRAYERALKAKAFDTVRVFLPTTSVTNLGAHLSGQSVENTINKMLLSHYSEVRLLGQMAYEELLKVVPNFLQNIEHKYGQISRDYRNEILSLQQKSTNKYISSMKLADNDEGVRLVDWDKNTAANIVSQLLFTGQTKTYFSKNEFYKWAIKKGNKNKVLKILYDSIPDRSQQKYNRRHKLPRAFEHAFIEVEFFKDFGIYRDLQRNRMSSTERLYLTAEHLHIPPEFFEKGMEEVYKDYLTLHKETIRLNKKVRKYGLEVSEYITILGNILRFNVRANIRQWIFFAELRTIAGGHPSYRDCMQKAVRLIIRKLPYLESLFAKVDWTPDYGLGRLKAEVFTQEALSKIKK